MGIDSGVGVGRIRIGEMMKPVADLHPKPAGCPNLHTGPHTERVIERRRTGRRDLAVEGHHSGIRHDEGMDRPPGHGIQAKPDRRQAEADLRVVAARTGLLGCKASKKPQPEPGWDSGVFPIVLAITLI